MTEINELIKVIEKVTKGEDWTNFNGKEDSLFVYEYDRLTEDTCDIIAECKTVEVAKFIADMPEQFRQFITTIESQQGQLETCKGAIEAIVEDHRNQKIKTDDWIQKVETEARGFMKENQTLREENKELLSRKIVADYQNEILVNEDLKRQIESQKEEIAEAKRKYEFWESHCGNSELRIESLKAITELAVKALREIQHTENIFSANKTAEDALSEIERLTLSPIKGGDQS